VEHLTGAPSRVASRPEPQTLDQADKDASARHSSLFFGQSSAEEEGSLVLPPSVNVIKLFPFVTDNKAE
jgi:hypothetical protein